MQTIIMEYEKSLTPNTSQRDSKHNGTIQESMHVSETLTSVLYM